MKGVVRRTGGVRGVVSGVVRVSGVRRSEGSLLYFK